MSIENIKQVILTHFDKSKLEFKEEEHKYYLEDEELISVTTYLKKYSNEFNEYIIASNIAKGNEEYKNNLIKYWKCKREEATTRGNRLHTFAELFPNQPTPSCWYEDSICKWMSNLEKRNLIVLFKELRIYSKDYGIAGTIDLVIYNKKTNKIVLVDWKTNSKSIYSYYKNNRLRQPYDNLKDSAFSKYILQLSVYKKIFEGCGLEVEKCKIIWLPPTSNYLVEDVRYNLDKTGVIKEKVFNNYLTEIDIICEDVELEIKNKKPIKTFKIGKRK